MVYSLKVVDGMLREVFSLNLKRVFCSMKCLASGKLFYPNQKIIFQGLNPSDLIKERKNLLIKLLFIKLQKEGEHCPQQDIPLTSSFSWI